MQVLNLILKEYIVDDQKITQAEFSRLEQYLERFDYLQWREWDQSNSISEEYYKRERERINSERVDALTLLDKLREQLGLEP